MRREAISLHGIPPDRIVETGAPLYDIFANAGRFGSRHENLTRLNFDPNRRLIVYGTSNAAYVPDEIEIVKRVAQWVEEDSLGVPCQLCVPTSSTSCFRALQVFDRTLPQASIGTGED